MPELPREILAMEAYLRAHPGDALTHYRLGFFYEAHVGDEARARESYLACHVCLAGFREPGVAIQGLQERIQARDEPLTHIRLGEILACMGDSEGAEAELKKGSMWVACESANFRINVVSGSTAWNERDVILARREEGLKTIRERFAISDGFPHPIVHFLYESRFHKRGISGDHLPAHAFPLRGEVHAVHGPMLRIDNPHEDAHIILRAWGAPSRFLQEGAAEFACHGEAVHAIYRRQLARTAAYSISSLMDDDAFDKSDQFATYPQAASFVAFLVQTGGMEKFRRLYGAPRSAALEVLRQGYGVELVDIEQKWAAFLAGQ